MLKLDLLWPAGLYLARMKILSALGIGIGIALGVAIGLMLENIGMGIGIGLALGIAMGALNSRNSPD